MDAPDDVADETVDETVDDLVTAVLTASRALVGVSAQSLAEVGDRVTVPQFRMLVVLERSRSARMTELAEHMGVQPSTALRMVDRLVDAGLVTREQNPDNRREVRLDLTHQGEDVVRAVTGRRRRAIHDIVEAIPPSQRSAVTEALRAFAVAAGEPEPRDRSAEQIGW